MVKAEKQTKGKGRGNRNWFSPINKGLYVSFGLFFKNRSKLNLLPLVAAISITETIEKIGQIEVKTKWPNDIMYQEKKMAGILIENIVSAEKIISIIGIGLNLSHSRDDFPSGLKNRATSLKIATDKAFDINRAATILADILLYWTKKLENNKELAKIISISNYNSMLKKGDLVTFHHNDKIITGIYSEINNNGEIIIIDKNGFQEGFVSGEIMATKKIELK